MSLKEFLNHLQQRMLQLRTTVQKGQQGRLRVLNLEDRRLLDATAGVLGGQLLLDGCPVTDSSGFFDADSSTAFSFDAGHLTVNDATSAGAANNWSVSFDAATNEVIVASSISDPNTESPAAVHELRIDAEAITGDIVFDGQGGDDVLKVDFSNGNPIVGSGLTFFGGSQSVDGVGDGLVVVGDHVLNAQYTPDDATFGSGEILVGGSAVRFEGLEPVDISGFATATLTLPSAADVLTVQNGSDFFDGGTHDALRVSGTSGGIDIETAAFWDNTQLVIDTVASGSDAVDLISVTSASNNHANTNLLIDTGSTVGDVIRIDGDVDFDGNLAFTSDAVVVNTASVIAGGDQVFSGRVTIDSDTQLTANGLQFFGTVDGDHLLHADSGTGAVHFHNAVGADSALSGLDVSGQTVEFSDTLHVDDEGLEVTSVLTTTFAADVTSTNEGDVVINNADQLILANGSDFQLDGSFAQTGPGSVTSGAHIFTTGDSISFASTLNQTAAVALVTTASGNSTGANISLQNVQSAGNSLQLDAGTSIVDLSNATNVMGDLAVTAGQATIAEADHVSQSGAWSVAGDVQISADGYDILLTDAANQLGHVSMTADNVLLTEADDIMLGSISAVDNVQLTTTASIVDAAADGVTHLSASSVSLSALNIGSADDDVFKPSEIVSSELGPVEIGPVEIDASTVNVTATGADPDGSVAIHLLSDSVINTLSGNHVFVSGDGNLDLSQATVVANSLSVVTTSGSITLPSTLTVTDDLKLEAQQIAVDPGNVIDLNANRILFVSGSSAELTITAAEFDGLTNGNLVVSNDSSGLQLTDLNCDLTAINTNGSSAVLHQSTSGTISQQQRADSHQNSQVLSDSLLLTGQGTFELTNTANNVSTLAAETAGPIAYADIDSFAVGTVEAGITSEGPPAGGTPLAVAGISTDNQNLLLQAGESIQIQQQVDVGTAVARMVVGENGMVGNLSQDAAGIVTASKLGVRNNASSGHLILTADNDVDVFAAENAAAGGTIAFQDSDELKIGSVVGASVPDVVFTAVTGISTHDGDVSIAASVPTTGPDSVLIDDPISAGDATVRLVAAGNVKQSTTGTIEANMLGVRQTSAMGDVILDDGNLVQELAVANAASSGTIAFRNLQSLTVGEVWATEIPASPHASAFQFAKTSGLTTDSGDIQLYVDGPAPTDGSLQLNAEVNAADAAVGIAADGAIQQTTEGAISATDLLVRQLAEAPNVAVNLGTADNYVARLAISNVSEGGDISFYDDADLTVTSVMVADVGGLSISAASGVHADAADINLTAASDLHVNEEINAASDTSTESIAEKITLISRSGDFVLADGTTISTDENPAPGIFDDSTRDRIDILAGTGGAGGIVDLGDPNTIEIRTDGGLAKQIAPRPEGFSTVPTTGSETAFVTLTDAANSRSSLTFEGDGFLGELEYVFGIAGEENLEVVVDWGVISLVNVTANGVAGNASLQPSGTYVFDASDNDKSVFYIDEGGQQYQISHIYQPQDLITTSNDRNGRQWNPNIVGVRFSVAQHESINIWGSAAVDPTTATPVTVDPYSGPAVAVTDAAGNAVTPAASGLALLSSTDTNGLKNLQAEASSQFPLANQTVTSSGKPEGLAEWEFIAGPPPGVVLFQPIERLQVDLPRIVPPPDSTVFSEISGDAFFGDGAASDASVGTDVYLQIRRYFERDADAEIVMARINDGDLISSRQAFEKFVAANPELQDGAGYEVWLVTETGGQRVERPVVQFEVTGGRPGPPTENMLQTVQPMQLHDVEFRQADAGDNTGIGADAGGSAETRAGGDTAAGGDSGSDTSNLPGQTPIDGSLVPPEAGPSDQSPAPVENPEADAGQRQSHWTPQPDPGGRLPYVATSVADPSFAGSANATQDVGPGVVDAGITESTAIAGVAAASYSAVARFRARQGRSTKDHSLTSRTMKLLRRKHAAACDTIPEKSP